MENNKLINFTRSIPVDICRFIMFMMRGARIAEEAAKAKREAIMKKIKYDCNLSYRCNICDFYICVSSHLNDFYIRIAVSYYGDKIDKLIYEGTRDNDPEITDTNFPCLDEYIYHLLVKTIYDIHGLEECTISEELADELGFGEREIELCRDDINIYLEECREKCKNAKIFIRGLKTKIKCNDIKDYDMEQDYEVIFK